LAAAPKGAGGALDSLCRSKGAYFPALRRKLLIAWGYRVPSPGHHRSVAYLFFAAHSYLKSTR
jgi:hypothetical protein